MIECTCIYIWLDVYFVSYVSYMIEYNYNHLSAFLVFIFPLRNNYHAVLRQGGICLVEKSCFLLATLPPGITRLYASREELA